MRRYRGAVAAIMIALVLASPVALFLVTSRSSPIHASVSDLVFGGNPHLNSSEPSHFGYVGVAYSYNANCTSPDNGTTTWTLNTDASWLSIVSGGTGSEFCNLSGSPTATGQFWANLTVNDTDSYDSINWTINVRSQGYWGTVETFADLPTGTHDPFVGNLAGGVLTLKDVGSDEESVVLDRTLYAFARADIANQTIIEYVPNHASDGLGWNMSLELYPTREESSYRAFLKPTPTLGLQVFVGDGAVNRAGAALYVGDRVAGIERVSVFNATSSTWTSLSLDVLPSYANRHDDNPEAPRLSESIYGERPDHYVVSFRYLEGSSSIRLTIYHTSGVLIGSLNVVLPAPLSATPKIQLVTDVQIAMATTPQRGYWAIDNLCFRGINAVYPVVGPVYEYITKGRPAWVVVQDENGVPVQNADVFIGSNHAAYNSTSFRYEAALSMPVGWSRPVNYSVSIDGVTLRDSMLTTVMPDLAGQKVSLPLWWNGWAWATVFGRDDSSYATAAPDTFLGYNHPATSYVMSAGGGGSSFDLLATQSEIALHYPHDYLGWPQRFWDEAVSTSDTGHFALENTYSFASRWDNPAYVGSGDTYITIACPGNSASWEQLFAEYQRGTRMMGISSNYYNGAPGNSSLIGSWLATGIPAIPASWTPLSTNWYPYTPYDLLDSHRGPNTDVNIQSSEWQLTFWMAQNGGVRRIYNHGIIAAGDTAFLHWIDDPKTNFSYENWKATDGEVASYVNGRWSTDIVFDSVRSNSTVDSYQVTRADPISAGYWRVPVTVAYNASGRQLSDIKIVEGPRTLLMSDGSLRNITGKRIMDVGFDIRGDTIYVSYFWNASSQLSFVLSESGPEPNTPPVASFIVDSYHDNVTKVFVFDASSSTDLQDPLSALQFRWDWEGDGVWDTDWSSNPVAYHQFPVPGNYTVKLEVMDSGGLTDEAQANIEVTDVEIPEMQSVFLVTVSMLLVFVAASGLSRRRANVRKPR